MWLYYLKTVQHYSGIPKPASFDKPIIVTVTIFMF